MTTAQVLNPEDLIRRAFHNLTALRANVPKGYIERKYAEQFHHALDQLEQVGYEVQEWRIPPSALHEFEYEDLVTRLDAVLGYFERPQERIGFQGPRR
jgi:hypothetical protein